MSEPEPRLRRSSDEVRTLLLEAAYRLFRERGFEQVGTREIAHSAGVTVPMLFRHFGSKAGLYEEAAFSPFVRFTDEFVDGWEPRSDRLPHDVARRYVDGLVTLCIDNRDLLATLVNGLPGPEGAQVIDRVAAQLDASLDRLSARVDSFSAELGFGPDVPIAIAVRFTVTFTVGTVLLGNALFNGISREQLVDHLTGFIVRGVGYSVSAQTTP